MNRLAEPTIDDATLLPKLLSGELRVDKAAGT